jgi:hypothetical protein
MRVTSRTLACQIDLREREDKGSIYKSCANSIGEKMEKSPSSNPKNSRAYVRDSRLASDVPAHVLAGIAVDDR